MLKNLRLRPILVSVLLLACAREAVCDDLVTAYTALFNDHVSIHVSGYQGGTNLLDDFPLLIRLSEGHPVGFSYARVDKAGKDIRFLYSDRGEEPVAVPYEVESWNPEGESLLWVRLPKINNNASSVLTMYWAPDDPSALPANDARAVWSRYAGVWHLTGASDSSVNDISTVVGEHAVSQVGVIGSALGSRVSGANGQIFTIAQQAATEMASGAYTISGWLRINNFAGTPWLYSARTTSSADAFGVEIVKKTSEDGCYFKLHANATTSDTSTKHINSGEWVHFAVVHESATGKHTVYINGEEFYKPENARTDAVGANGFSFGGLVGDGAGGTLNGDLDDVRIAHAKTSPSYFKNEYAQATSSSYVTFDSVVSTGRDVYIPEEPVGPSPEIDPESGEQKGDPSPSDYAGTAVLIPQGIEEGVVLTNFVTLVNVWQNEPAGFFPDDLPFGTEDLRFFDEDGNVLAYEIDSWGAGEIDSIWVKVPQLTRTTRITMCWGLRVGKTLPPNDPYAVWSDYAGVWHLSDERDSTTNNATGTFGENAVLMYGQVGKAAGTMVSGPSGAILDVESNAAIDSLTNGPFTVSGWVYLNRATVNHGALFSRATATDAAWGARFCGGETGDNSAIEMTSGTASMRADVTVPPLQWTRFDFVYSTNQLALYINGEKKKESVQKISIRNGSFGRFSLGGLVSAAQDVLGEQTLNGYLDEVRLRYGALDETALQAESDQCQYDDFYDRRPSSWDDSAILQNRWRVLPTVSKTEWNEGEEPAEVTIGEPWHGVSELTFVNRATGEATLEMPTVAGDYRAVFTCAPTENYSSLTYTVDFHIRFHRPTHDLGEGNDRVLLLNNDESVADGKVFVQSYSDSVLFPGRPYWVHDVDTEFDYTSTSPYYNFCGGMRHTYYARGAADGRTRLWDLIDVRFGNTYNNADFVFDEFGDWEEWEDGLLDEMNYLPWNPQGGCLVDLYGLQAEGWHEYAAQAVMCNTLRASINSTLYTNGIGTIYFDAVNSHIEDATNGYYKLVVEVATNAIDRATGRPVGIPTDAAIVSTYNDGAGVYDSYKFADWKPMTMHVRLINGTTMTDLGTTDELTLDLAGGGSYTNFYRVYVPVDVVGAARFRIRRTAINPAYTISADVHSMILVDNVICSLPTDRLFVEPRGHYDETKVKRETSGYEGAFSPSYPGVTDADIFARVRAFTSSGKPVSAGSISSIQMHYRWRYLNQQCTDWQTVDINPLSLTSIAPLVWPQLSGDLEYWYDTSQSGAFYQYADYSGLNLGLPGYSEEVLAVTNRAPTYATDGRDWFTRVRDGKSTYGAMKLFVRRGETASVETIPMFVVRDHIWRGCLQTTNAIPEGVYFRFEGWNQQDETRAEFQFNTNGWYLAEAKQALPVSGSVVAGSTNNWGQIPCDATTGHILFQLDESTRALTIVHADWQDFNEWSDAHHDYFSGASVADATKAGTSASRREYLCQCNRWTDDHATNDEFWTERFRPASLTGYEFFRPFLNNSSPNGFTVGEGMWIPNAYAMVAARGGYYEQAFQMAGQGRGDWQMVNRAVLPRGIESVKLNARVAQTVSPSDFVLFESGSELTNYTFITRAAFDLHANSNFTGNASLSLAAFYRPNTSCYEARWEQIAGDVEDGSGVVLGPKPRGQRLALYRWNYQGNAWRATELYAATNTETTSSWKDSAPKAIPQTYSITNGLMPFLMGAYDNKAGKYTVVVAAVHIPGTKEADQVKGSRIESTLDFLAKESGWFYLVYRDTSADRLTRGTYGALSANCEGVFARPQFYPEIVSWDTAAKTKTLTTQIKPGPQKAQLTAGREVDCVGDLIDDYWVVPNGRMEAFYETKSDPYNGFRATMVTQTVDLYTAPIGTSSWSSVPLASQTITGFGKPGVAQDVVFNLWSTDDASIRIRAGGTIADVRTDVVVDNIQISQWRGQDWLGWSTTEQLTFGPTNFVYTSGWIHDGALQLSPKRTKITEPCSLRMPLCDGEGTRQAPRGQGLGSLMVEYRNAQPNARLLVQIATNRVTQESLGTLTKSLSEGWTTLTNIDFSVMTSDERAYGIFECSPGLHGVKGVMRVLVDPTLQEEVRDETDPEYFGSVEIVSALFRDEPPLDKGCWWGFNIRTMGDVNDIEQRMYLPDNPLRSAAPKLTEIGQSLALNNSITVDCDPKEVEKVPNPFREHMPFLQTPTFASNIVGEVSFKARKYTLQKSAQYAEVTLYGTQAVDVDDVDDRDWDELNVFIISNSTYETYRFKTDASSGYRAFRFAVTGVEGVIWPGHKPICGDEPVRVLLDDVLVSEAVRARLAFRNVGAFRHDIEKTTYVPNVPSAAEQPICGEGWGIQAEIYPAMLGEEIDLTVKPRVRLHYYKGKTPWGFSQWKDRGTSGWMTLATDTNGFYRSSALDSPTTVIPMSTTLEEVQYMLEVVYTVVNPETGHRSMATNWLESTDWAVPSWYAPVDYNNEFGNSHSSRFAAFAIIDSIAPGWAWINEINLFGELDYRFQNLDEKKQFVEIALPSEYDLTGWELRILSAQSLGRTDSVILTNTVARFDGKAIASKKDPSEKCNYMSFIVVGNPTTELKREKGEYDGAWHFEAVDNEVFQKNDVLSMYNPMAVQLVRPSQIVEHEVAILGTNVYGATFPAILWQYETTNLVHVLRTQNPNTTVFALPDDEFSPTTSVGVYDSRGESATWWNKTMKLTPGEINENQTINPDHPTPSGELIMVFAGVDTSFGRIVQTVGSGTNTTELQTVTVKRGSEAGLDIYYTVSPWCELGTVKELEDGRARTPIISAGPGPRQYKVNVAKGAERNVTVTASAAIDTRLKEYGLTERNRYTPAVLNWLERHTDAYGNDFYGWGDGTTNDTIHLAKFISLSGTVTNDMTLTQMYWLDIDPTMGEMYFRAGMVRPPSQEVWVRPTYDASEPEAITNLRVGVYMSISNGNGRAEEKLGRMMWAPYVLRGLGPGELSWDYNPDSTSSGAWTSETFKVTGFLNNGLTHEDDVSAWIPLRYFVFKEDSFDSNFETEIDVDDPFSSRSPAYSQGWNRWMIEHGGEKPPVYLSWSIDERLQPITTEILAPTNRLYSLP